MPEAKGPTSTNKRKAEAPGSRGAGTPPGTEYAPLGSAPGPRAGGALPSRGLQGRAWRSKAHVHANSRGPPRHRRALLLGGANPPFPRTAAPTTPSTGGRRAGTGPRRGEPPTRPAWASQQRGAARCRPALTAVAARPLCWGAGGRGGLAPGRGSAGGPPGGGPRRAGRHLRAAGRRGRAERGGSGESAGPEALTDRRHAALSRVPFLGGGGGSADSC